MLDIKKFAWYHDYCYFYVLNDMIFFGGEFLVRINIILACAECNRRNYSTVKNKKNDPGRLEMRKYCKFCRKHTLHKETK